MKICIRESCFFELTIKRKAIKNAYIRVRPNRNIIVSAPLNMTSEQISDMLERKSDWILAASRSMPENYTEKAPDIPPISKKELESMRLDAEDKAMCSFERVYPLVKPLGIGIPEIRVRYMTTRWGSCILNKNRIWLNVYLAKLPDECMDYVLLHEIVHFIYPNHGEDFKHMLDKLMPEGKKIKNMLKEIRIPSRREINNAEVI